MTSVQKEINVAWYVFECEKKISVSAYVGLLEPDLTLREVPYIPVVLFANGDLLEINQFFPKPVSR